MRSTRACLLCLVSWVLLVGTVTDGHAQDRLRLERMDAPRKHRRLKLDYYQIHTADTVLFRKVIGYDRTTLFLEYEERVGDTLVTYRGEGVNPGRKFLTSRYRTHSSQLPIDEVTYLMMGRNGRSSIHEPFAWVGWSGSFAVAIAAPFAIFGDNGENLDTWAAGAAACGGFLAASWILHQSVSKGEEWKKWCLVAR